MWYFQFLFYTLNMSLYGLGICDIAVNFEDQDHTLEVSKCVVKLAKHIQIYSPVRHLNLVNVNEVTAKALHNELQGLRFVSRTSPWYNDNRHNDAYIIMSSDYEDMKENFNALMRDMYWNTAAKYVIIVERLNGKLDNVSNMLLRNNIFNATIIGKVHDEEYEIYAFNTKLDSCNRPSSLEYITNCSEYNEEISIFRIATPTKIQGCHVKLIAFQILPFVNFDDSLVGVEQYVLHLIEKYEGIKFELIRHVEEGRYGKLINFTYTGMLYRIQNHLVDGAIGAYYMDVNRIRFLDFLYPYAVDNKIILVARSGVLSIWKAVALFLTLANTFVIFFFFIIFSIIVVKMGIFRKCDKDTSGDLLIVFGYFFNNINVRKMKTGTPHRLIVLNMLLFVILMYSLIQACLFSEKTHPMRDYQIDHYPEVISGYNQITPDRFPYESHVNKSMAVCSSIVDCVLEVKRRKNERLFTTATNIILEHVYWDLVDDEGKLEVHKIEETLGYLLHTMYFRRGSTVLPFIQKLIQRILHAGLVDRALKKSQIPQRVKHIHREPWVPLETLDLIDAFYLLAAGVSLSIVTFICEIIYKKATR